VQETPSSLSTQILHLPIICLLPGSLRIWVGREVRDQLGLKEAIVKIRGTTQGNLLSIICTAILLKPNITSNNSNPVEGDDSVSLTCDSYTDPDNINYLWSRNGESLSEGDRLKLSEGNRTLTLLNVTRNDTGPYVCETRNPVSVNRSDPFSLNIICE
jgi:hypothetical protein